MSHSHSHPILSSKKQYLAAALAAVALLSYMVAAMSEKQSRHTEASVGVLTAVAATSDSGYEMFLKLDTIAGDSSDQKHKNEIEVDSFAWGETRGVGATRPTMEGLKITMPATKVSPRLFLYTAGGLKITRAVLSVRRAGSDVDSLKWILTDAQITSFQTVGNVHGDGVTDQITLSPAKIEVEYLPEGGGASVKAGWDQRTGKSVGY